MNKKRSLVLAFLVTAAAGLLARQTISAPSQAELARDTASDTFTVQSPTITSTPTYENCGYTWAYHDDLELSAKLNDAVHTFDPAASANAQLFGEDCVYADGHSTFGAMETDFYVHLPVADLSAEEALGNWIEQVMDVIITLPEDEVQGRKGFTEFSFIKSDVEQITIRIDISDYLTNAAGATGRALLQKFHTPAPLPTTPIPMTPATP